MKDFFGLDEKKTNARTEIVAGLTTFFTMAYIIFVNPSMLSSTGMSFEGVFVATCLSPISREAPSLDRASRAARRARTSLYRTLMDGRPRNSLRSGRSVSFARRGIDRLAGVSAK